ncbi:MAG TPA: DNA-processing protein DprA [Longimicrobium sp.]|jgi:DNA processing protein
MNDTGDFFWFRLSRLPGIGPKTLWRLNAAAEARSLVLHDLIAGTAGPVGEREVPRIQALLAEQDTAPLVEEHAALQSRRVSILHPGHSCFPSGVTRHGNEFGLPPVLFARGHLPLAHATGVAIVGSRTIEEDGIQFARGLAAELAGEGLNVVSGFAKGADMAGHTGSLRASGTTTVALSLGILNFEAKAEIKPLLTSTNTLVLSQFHPRARWMARNAMARNKLVCALSRAVVVVASGPEMDEQGRASGTFDTARTALAMNVPVFVLSPRALRHPPVGNAALIRMGCRELFPDDAIVKIVDIVKEPSAPRDLAPQIAMF